MITPLVLGMPRPMAEALGWPEAEIGWADILALAQIPEGWGAFGHPEWGDFRLGQDQPQLLDLGSLRYCRHLLRRHRQDLGV